LQVTTARPSKPSRCVPHHLGHRIAIRLQIRSQTGECGPCRELRWYDRPARDVDQQSDLTGFMPTRRLHPVETLPCNPNISWLVIQFKMVLGNALGYFVEFVLRDIAFRPAANQQLSCRLCVATPTDR
jgi:hypothetical protein